MPPKKKKTTAKTKKPITPVKKEKKSPAARATKDTGKKAKTKYFVFKMQCGKEESIESFAEAMDFMEDNQGIIAKKFEFTTKAAYENHKANAAKASALTTPMKVEAPHDKNVTKPSPIEQEKINKIREMMENSRPCNRIELFWKTTKRSKLAVIIIRFLNMNGQDQWFVKPDQIDNALKHYVSEFPNDNNTVQEALAAISHARMRDPEGDAKSVMTVKWKAKNTSTGDESIEKHFDQYVAYTLFEIPVDTITTQEEEASFIEDITRAFGATLKEIMASHTFIPCLQTATSSDSMWHAMTNPRKGLGFQQYIEECKIKVQPCQNLNTHIVLQDSNFILNKLYEANIDSSKYPSTVARELHMQENDGADSVSTLENNEEDTKEEGN